MNKGEDECGRETGSQPKPQRKQAREPERQRELASARTAIYMIPD